MMKIFNIFFEKTEDEKKPIDPNKSLKEQLYNEGEKPENVIPRQQEVVSIDGESEIYKKQREYFDNVFKSMNTTSTSYPEFLNQINFLKDVIDDKTKLYSKAFQMHMKNGGDKYSLQNSAVQTLEKFKIDQKSFNDVIVTKINENETQTIKEIDDLKKNIINLEREINENKKKLQELNSNIAVVKNDLEQRKNTYNYISNEYQTKISEDIKDIQKFIN